MVTMNKQNIATGLIALLLLSASCSGPKNISKQQVVVAAVEQTEQKLDDEKQRQFDYLFVEALKQKMFGNGQKAVQLLSSCLEIDPNSSAAMFELANIHATNNDYTSASLLLEKAIELNPDNKWYKILLARIYQQSKKFSEAADLYANLLEKDPDNLELMYSNAILLSNAQRFEEAISAYDAMEKKSGINEQISVSKQQLYLSTGDIEKAFSEIQKLIDQDPENPKYYGLLADLYMNTGDTSNGLKYYQKILEMDPSNGFVHFSLANYYLTQGDPEKSFEHTKLGFRSQSVMLQNKLQLYMMLTSDRQKSNITLDKEEILIDILLQQYPNDFLVHTMHAESLIRQQKLSEARTALLKALEIQPSDYSLWERVLFIDSDLQAWNDLYDHSLKTMELFPNQPQGYFMNALASIQLEKFDETIKVVDEGLDYVIDNPQLRGNFLMLKGEAVYKAKSKGEAFEIFDQAISAFPDNHIALNNYAYYLSLDGGDLDKAERMSGKVIERFPDNSTYLDTYAWVLFKKGEYSLARFYMESAIKNGGEDNATLLEHYGDILFMLERTAEAIKYWEKARELGGDSQVLLKKIKEGKYFEE